jgi:hypothetical protein
MDLAGGTRWGNEEGSASLFEEEAYKGARRASVRRIEVRGHDIKAYGALGVVLQRHSAMTFGVVLQAPSVSQTMWKIASPKEMTL